MSSSMLRRALQAATIAGSLGAATPAFAQFYWQPYDYAGQPQVAFTSSPFALSDATPAESDAALLWNLRAGLNVAALQCQFEPTLLTLSNYNSLLENHRDELKAAYGTLNAYYKRKLGAKQGPLEMDRYSTRVYISFSSVSSQLNFCQTAGAVGRDAIFAPRGHLIDVARKRVSELRSSLVRNGEQYFRTPRYAYHAPVPPLQDDCWGKGNTLEARCRPVWNQIYAQLQ